MYAIRSYYVSSLMGLDQPLSRIAPPPPVTADVVEEEMKFSLAPAEVISVACFEGEQKSCKVIVPNNQLSLAIGNKGQNAKLAARLTGYKIDITPEIPVN